MRDNLDDALRLMFGHEGGYSNHPKDPGGPTKYGITKKTLEAHRGRKVSIDEVKNLTIEEAEDVYRKSYWAQSGGDLLPDGLDYAAFDFGVNSGPSRAVRTLQELLGVDIDGIVGVKTADAANKYPGGIEELIRAYCDARMRFLRKLKNWGSFSRGWTIRVTGKDPKGQYPAKPGVVGDAITLARGIRPATSATTQTVEVPKAPPEKPNPWTTPETIAAGAAAAGGLLAAIGDVSGPVGYALAVAIVVATGVAAFYFVTRLRRTPA